jgi:hypothetical protein
MLQQGLGDMARGTGRDDRLASLTELEEVPEDYKGAR